jgi:hypothetical protein
LKIVNFQLASSVCETVKRLEQLIMASPGAQNGQDVLLSLCMIVRDNERTLGPCLASARPWVDEIVVVDTGSTDGTAELARGFGARVFPFSWCDDFSAARNESLRHARGEWIFWMDSDETIEYRSGRGLRELVLGAHRADVFGYFMQQLNGLASRWNGHVDVTAVDRVRLFRNRADLRFEGRVHEQIIPAIRRAGGRLVWTDLTILHSGADETPEQRQRKAQYYLRLLEQEIEEKPDQSPRAFVLFNLGMTHAAAGAHDKAIECLRRGGCSASTSASRPSKPGRIWRSSTNNWAMRTKRSRSGVSWSRTNRPISRAGAAWARV